MCKLNFYQFFKEFESSSLSFISRLEATSMTTHKYISLAVGDMILKTSALNSKRTLRLTFLFPLISTTSNISYILKLLSSLDMSWRQWIWMLMTPSSSMQTGFNKRINFMIWRFFCQKCCPFFLIRGVWLVGIIK